MQAETYTLPPSDDQLINAFYQGYHCARKAGFLADNPHSYEGSMWTSWREGFEFNKRGGRL
jgi:hypothetical protein